MRDALLIVALSVAAPALKGGEPEIVGQFDWSSLRSPTVTLWVGGERTVVWLVFTDHATENQANKFQAGDRVRIRGQLAKGGGYRYVLVAGITKDE